MQFWIFWKGTCKWKESGLNLVNYTERVSETGKLTTLSELVYTELQKRNKQSMKRGRVSFSFAHFVERMETEDNNFFVKVQHQIDPLRSKGQRHTPKIN